MAWSLEHSKKIYGVGTHDLHFLDISPEGKLVITLHGHSITFEDVCAAILEQTPMMVRVPSFTLRIPQLVTYQVRKLISSFATAGKHFNYSGSFQPVYPIKVNARKTNIQTILASDKSYGLEAGTKSELVIVLKALRERPERKRLIMANGVKDAGYVEIVRQALNDGYNIVISVESLDEVKLTLEMLPRDKLQLALRIKPYTHATGYWKKSVGRNSKFGLGIHDLLAVEEYLTEQCAQEVVVGIHGHPGSQLEGGLGPYVSFLAQTYKQIRDRGFVNLQTINYGGGLAIDYTGRLRPDLFEYYSSTIVESCMILKSEGYPSPNIMVEAGRAITALSVMIAIETIDVRHIYPNVIHSNQDASNAEDVLVRYRHLVAKVTSRDELVDVWVQWQQEQKDTTNFTQLYVNEYVTGVLRDIIREKLVTSFPDYTELSKNVLDELFFPDALVIGNFSVFNSVCDHVLIGQYFPMIPVDALDKQPETLTRLVDITCDSDGEISTYIPKEAKEPLFTKDYYPLTTPSNSLEWHGFPVGDLTSMLSSHIVIPLAGAYQDVIEFDHNLLGDLPNVQLTLTPDGEWVVEWVGAAQNIQALVKLMGYHIKNFEDPFLRVGKSN